MNSGSKSIAMGSGLESESGAGLTWLKQQVDDLEFDNVGWVALERPFSMDRYITWIAQGQHGDMSYLADHMAIKENPQQEWPELKSAFVFAKSYQPHPFPEQNQCSGLNIARYAQGQDYHIWFKRQLNQVVERMTSLNSESTFLPMSDSGPVLERDLAYRAGLGWIGKNTCLIDSKLGSYFFLGEIYTSLRPPKEAVKNHPNRCGTCDKCIVGCPTGALSKSGGLDARKCLSYWNIESKEIPPDEIKVAMGDQFFGCDICQEVCPWNKKIERDLKRQAVAPVVSDQTIHPKTIDDRDEEQSSDKAMLSSPALEVSLKWVLSTSGREIRRHLVNNPLLRARPFGLKRNALIVIGNLKLKPLKPIVKEYTKNPRLGQLASWCLNQLH